MAGPQFVSDTGVAPLPDVGLLDYNGVTFSCLYTSSVNGGPVPDEAGRVTKYVEYEISVEGIVTLDIVGATTDALWVGLRALLTQPGAPLYYVGKGFGPLAVNVPGGQIWDVAWGPMPKLLFFQPLGGSKSALIRWQCLVRIPEVAASTLLTGQPRDVSRVLQFNYALSLTFDEEGYTGWSARGTLEVPMTRTARDARDLQITVDAYRSRWLDLQVDLTQFRVVRRNFEYSRDRRTIEWEYQVEELPPMGLPPSCTLARGTMSVRHRRRQGGTVAAGITWNCSLRCTYTVRKDADQRVALEAFYALLWFRMQSSARAGDVPPLNNPDNGPQQPAANGQPQGPPQAQQAAAAAGTGALPGWARLMASAQAPQKASAFLTDFGWDEGLYLDSKSITFQASWWMIAPFVNVFRAAGTWRWLDGSAGGSQWAQSVQDMMGWASWLVNRVDEKADALIDVGNVNGPPAGTPLVGPPPGG